MQHVFSKYQQTSFKAYFIGWSLCLLLLLAEMSFCYGQGKTFADSIYAVLASTPPAQQAPLLNSLAEYHLQNDLEKATRYAEKAYDIAQTGSSYADLFHANINLGECMLGKNDYQEALNHFFKANKLARDNADSLQIGLTLAKIGVVYYFQDLLQKALDYELEAIAYMDEEKQRKDYASAINCIAYILGKQNRTAEALNYHNEAFNIRSKLKDSNELAKSYKSLGDYYQKQGNYYGAEEKYQEALNLSRSINNKRGEAIATSNIGFINHKLGKTERALSYLHRAMKLQENGTNRKELSLTYHYLGLVHTALNNTDSARWYLGQSLKISEDIKDRYTAILNMQALGQAFINNNRANEGLVLQKKAVQLATESKIPALLAEVLHTLASSYMQLNDADNFMRYHKMHRDLTDSLNRNAYNDEITALQLRLSQQRKENDRLLLWKEDMSRAQEQRRATHNRNIFLSIVTALAVIIALLVIFSYTRQKLLRQVSLKNQQLESANRELVILNQRLHESEQQLKAMNNTQNKFFTIIAHDLRSPLSALSGLLSVIHLHGHDNFSPQDFRNYTETIAQSLNSVTTLLNNLLDWARVQSGNMPYQPADILLNELIEENLNLARLQAKDKQIQIDAILPKQPVSIMADRNMLHFTLRNLLANAIKFTHQGGQVMLEVTTDRDYVHLLVKDNGMGVPEHIRNSLFEHRMYIQSGTAGEKGTGLGLVLCKEFVEKNKGYITYTPHPEQGSVFQISLPLHLH